MKGTALLGHTVGFGQEKPLFRASQGDESQKTILPASIGIFCSNSGN